MGHEKNIHFIPKRDLKGAQVPKFNFEVDIFFELIVLKFLVVCRQISSFSYSFKDKFDQICLIFHLILMQFLFCSSFMSYSESIQKTSTQSIQRKYLLQN
jgi:hypothetical protein